MASPAESDRKSITASQDLALDADRDCAPAPALAKRKLVDRSLSPKELDRKPIQPAPPLEMNGSNVSSKHDTTYSPAPRNKRLRRLQSPIWAQSADSLGNKMPSQANFVLQKRGPSHSNGKGEGGTAKIDLPSRPASPETARTSTSSASKPAAPRAPPPTEPGPQHILGPWEASITGVKPYEEISKTVADFIFIHVVNNPDIKEINSRGIQFEIEAKLGTLIDKDTNCRVDRLLDTECVLHDNGRVAFRSSMTEVRESTLDLTRN